MKLTTSPQVANGRFKRSSKGISYKKLFSSHQKSLNGIKREVIREKSPCDNSDDSGLGIENSPDYLYNSSLLHPTVFKYANSQKRILEDSYITPAKRHRGIIDPKNDYDLNNSYIFPMPPVLPSNSICLNSSNIQTPVTTVPSRSVRRSLLSGKRITGPITLSSQLSSSSRNGEVQLQILNQPEQQHRARYQTEGSRGAVKDRTGNGFPVVKVTGYNRLTTLQVFIGSDQGRVTPHMFYQACRVTGKNSTPCTEKNIGGTIVIEIDVEPSKDMVVTCDCVGILKERNVDVEHRFPDECSTRSKKKSTRCRMVFRTVITNNDSTTETLQVASQSIACTQPPGVPEICKKSLTNCPVSGSKELFILGKNFLKDTHVLFQTDDWEQSVNPDKEFLQQTHLVCVVPPYKSLEVTESVLAKISVVSGNRASEPHTFTYVPINAAAPSITSSDVINENNSNSINATASIDAGSGLSNTVEAPLKSSNSPTDDRGSIHPVLLWQQSTGNLSATNNSSCSIAHNDTKIMPPLLMLPRRPSVQMITDSLSSSKSEGNLRSLSEAASNSQLSNQCSYAPSQFTTLTSEVSPMIQDFANNYNSAASNLENTLKNEVVPKIEPLSDTAYTDAFSIAQQNATTESQMCLVSGVKNISNLGPSQTSEVYPTSSGYMYSTGADLYSNSISKTEPEIHSNVETLRSEYDSNVSSAAAQNIILSSSHTAVTSALKSPETSNNYINSAGPLSLNSVVSNMNMLPTMEYSTKADNVSAISNVTESPFNQNKQRFDTLIDLKSQSQQSVSCPISTAISYDSISSAAETYQNFMNMDSTSLTSSEQVGLVSGNILYEKSSDKATVVLNEATSFCTDAMRPRKNSLNFSSVMSIPKPMNNDNSFLNVPSRDATTVLNEFVPANLVENNMNAVSKLEELMNSAAESIRSVNESTTSCLNLLSDASVPSSQNCMQNSMPLDLFLSSNSSQNGLNIETSLLVPSDEHSSAFQQCNSLVKNMNIASSNIVTSNEPSEVADAKNMATVKEEKQINIPHITKKSEEGAFTSEINEIIEQDILNYINRSCFNEVNIKKKSKNE